MKGYPMLQTRDKEVLLQFLKDWCKPMTEILNLRFGRGKIGHIIIAVSTDNEPTITYVTNLRDADFKRCLQLLAAKLNARKIQTLN